MNNPLVSVLLPCYNHAKYIGKAINSVIEQSYPDIELIVIDDGSQDDSFEIIKQLSDKHGFYAEKQENMGLSRTLNKMLDMAQGKYICMFGSDDIMLKDKTAKQVEFMEANKDISVCGGNALLIDGAGEPIEKRQKSYPYREITFEALFGEKVAGIEASSCMISKKALDHIGGWDPDIPLEDMYMWFKLLSSGYRMIGFGEPLIYYRMHGKNTHKNIRHMYESLIKTIAPYSNHPMYQQVHTKIQRSYFLKSSKKDKKLALEILKGIPFSAYNSKIFRGLVYLLKP